MNEKYLYFCLVIFGIIALYPSCAMIMIWIDVWNVGQKLLYEPNLTIKIFETVLTFLGFAFQIFVIFYFFLKQLGVSKKE